MLLFVTLLYITVQIYINQNFIKKIIQISP